MIPLIVSRGIGSGTNHAIGFVIFGGQSMALVLTLVVTPVAYSLFDDLSHRVFGRQCRANRTAALARGHRSFSGVTMRTADSFCDCSRSSCSPRRPSPRRRRRRPCSA